MLQTGIEFTVNGLPFTVHSFLTAGLVPPSVLTYAPGFEGWNDL